MEVKRIAGIITYNPELGRLHENVGTILPQVDCLIIVDNGSSNVEDIHSFIDEFEKVYFVCNSQNVGVAKALNEMAEKAMEFGAEWLLTLDQDSVVAANIMEEYVKHISDTSIGIVTCRYVDRNTDNIYHFTSINDL